MLTLMGAELNLPHCRDNACTVVSGSIEAAATLRFRWSTALTIDAKATTAMSGVKMAFIGLFLFTSTGSLSTAGAKVTMGTGLAE